MTALPEYKTRILLERENIPVIRGSFVAADPASLVDLPLLPVYLKAQIPGATSRAAHGLVRRVETEEELATGLKELLAPGDWGQAEGVLVCAEADIMHEYYAACMLDFGSADQAPGGILFFSIEGGSGVEERSSSLRKIPFSILHPPEVGQLAEQLHDLEHAEQLAGFLFRFIRAFINNRLSVLETNPLCLLSDNTLAVIDCRAEYEPHAVTKNDRELYISSSSAENDRSPLEALVEKINEQDPAGTGFIRETRESPPENSWRVATNLCGGGGKMLWEMTTGARPDIFSMNESDTSGGLSAFKSYRILRAILEHMDQSQVLILTGSGMGFQNQRYLASAMWKGLRESPRPLPAMLRFGGTDEDKARALFSQVSDSLPVKVKIYQSHVFPNAMVDDIEEIATKDRLTVTPEPEPEGDPVFSVEVPQADFFFNQEKWPHQEPPPGVSVCPSNFLVWNAEQHTIEPSAEARCTGCLECETVSLLESNGELRIRLSMPEEKE